MSHKKAFNEFKKAMYKKWSHNELCKTHMDHIFKFITLVKCYISVEFEIYYTINFNHDIKYINDILNVKYFI